MKNQVSIRTKEDIKNPFEILYDSKLSNKAKVPTNWANLREFKTTKQKKKNFCYLADKQERPNV